MNNLAGILTRSADQHGERLALVDEQRTVNYRDLANAVATFAETLEDRVRPGDGAAIFLPNGIEFVRSFFAIARLGGVVVPLNDQYKEIELTRLLNEGAFASIITSRLNGSLLDRVAGSAARSCRIVFVEDHPWDTLPAGRNPPESRLDAPVLQQFSSGSTGNPKRICRTHRNLLFELDSLARTLVLSPQDRFLGVTPFSHVNGLVRSMMASLYAGATLYPLVRFQREAVVEIVERQRISVFIGVPFMFGVLAKSRFSRPPDFSSLRLCVSASAPMPLKLNRKFHDAFGVHVRQLYGSTETGTISVDLSSELERSLRSVGKPLPGVEVNVYNDKGVNAEISEIGEIAVKSRAAIARYEEEDELNRSVFKDGFFLTGDLGFKDEDGRVYLVGRKKLFINKGGYKINPREVEDLLELHPKVEEAVVIGVPTTFQDERVKATLVVNASCTAQEILEHCRGKIADFKVPSLVEFRERIPKTATGKIRRDLLLQEETSGEAEERV